MKTLGRVAVGLGLLLMLVAAVVVVRTVTYRAPGEGPLPHVAASGPVDLAGAADRLGQAVRIQTVSHQDPAEDDPKALTALHDWLAKSYPRLHGVALRESVGPGALIWTWKGSDPSLAPIILMAHQDVVPVAPETLGQWRAPPFSGVVRDGAVWGRGSIDDKGSLVSLMEAGETLAASGFRPRRTILIVSGQDEERGGTGADAIAAALKARGVQALFALDEGSALIADNPVTHGPAALIGTAEKGYATLRITAKAAGGHSSAPPPTTAVTVLAKAVLAIADHPFAKRFQGPSADMLRALAPQMPFASRMAVANAWLFRPLLVSQIGATPQGAAMLHTTIAPTMLTGSPKDNVLPDRATARINYRIAPGDTAAEVMARARSAVGALPVDLAFEGAPRDPSPVSSTSSEGWRAVVAATKAVAPGVPVAPSLVIAATDSRRLSGVARDVYRYQPIVFRLRDTEMIHGVDEHLTLANLERMIRFYEGLMKTAAG